MKKPILNILLIFECIFEVRSDCWSEIQGYKCCPEGTPVAYTDENGEWGVINNKWCGIQKKVLDDYCWSELLVDEDQDGYWGAENGKWCGMKNSVPRWNNRELNDETRSSWNNFKEIWDKEYQYNFERLSVFVGEDESKLNFGWYSTDKTTPKVRYSSNSNMIDSKLFEGDDWEPAIKYKTGNSDDFSFIFVGDPQIGGSSNRYSPLHKDRKVNLEEGIRNDAYNWNVTIVKSFEYINNKYNQNPSLLMSAGDQADTMNQLKNDDEYISQEKEYSAFLLPELLKNIPSAITVGNHEHYTDTWGKHFNTPHPQTDISYNATIPGYNYFFKYNNVLVVVLETSHYRDCVDFNKTVTNAIKTYPHTDWRIAMFHHDIYSNGRIHSHSDDTIAALRPCLSSLLYNNKFDFVINGHDHVYVASNFVTYDDKNEKHGVIEISTDTVYENPDGTLYITANCATGIIKFDNNKNNNGKTRLEVSNIEVETFNILDGPYIFEKQMKCWAKILGYECCAEDNKIVYDTTSDGEWGYDYNNNEWCGIIRDDIPNTSNTATTTTTINTTTTTTTTTSTTTTTTTTSNTPEPSNCADQYELCGGKYHTGPTCCKPGYTCVYKTEYYSQCLPSN
ncbi:carbohydrate-binding module family 1 protein [Piromyces sp. E2]|nr:carbohydrate-binding module family 1 protein [Piromyces sp. E2]|eukprot:OUM66243.1 carbohydrate-binding module family 1 protein [Piromyces sp. E2]